MARPRVFVSSTYYDLKHVRASMEVFIDSLGFDAILFEKGDVAFHPDSALDESCYREARTSDIFVLIVGGRYGSPASSERKGSSEIPTDYESITRREFEAAQEADIPTFILVDGAVHAEYQTFIRNRDNKSVKYAHVDSPNVFILLESIFELGRNNPVFAFDRATDIEAWLREQWAGLFRELLRTRSQQQQLSTLNAQVMQLQSVNDTLKTYLEAVLTKVTPDDSARLITDEEKKLSSAKRESEYSQNGFVNYLTGRGIDDHTAKSLISEPNSAGEAIERVSHALMRDAKTKNRGFVLKTSRGAQMDYNAARTILGVAPLDFSSVQAKEDSKAADMLADAVLAFKEDQNG